MGGIHSTLCSSDKQAVLMASADTPHTQDSGQAPDLVCLLHHLELFFGCLAQDCLPSGPLFLEALWCNLCKDLVVLFQCFPEALTIELVEGNQVVEPDIEVLELLSARNMSQHQLLALWYTTAKPWKDHH